MRGYLLILRPLNCIIAGFAVLVGARLGSPLFLSETVFLAVAAAFLICGAGNTINDYFDLEIDLVNKPSRPIPSGLVSKGGARNYSLLLFAAGMMLAFFVNLPAFILAVINSILLYRYASDIKRKGGFAKNLSVSYLVASPFLFGGLAVENPGVTFFLVIIALLVNTSREIIKDIEDYEGDAGHLQSLPVKFGFKTTSITASLFIAASILLSPFPYILKKLNIYYLILVASADLLLVISMLKVLQDPQKGSRAAQRLIKAAMVLALAGFFLGIP